MNVQQSMMTKALRRWRIVPVIVIEDPPPGVTGDGNITATINGTPWRSSCAADRAAARTSSLLIPAFCRLPTS
ncbi:MAG: hypothetical protein M3373_07210 [Gemmatimonadota bacterium]|nr:hypothetical protein [Gemmatimonadota bacterium]